MNCPYCELNGIEAEVIVINWLSRCERCNKDVKESRDNEFNED